jgi:hypothetical protein
MQALDLFNEIVATYQRHGWQLRRVLLRPQTREAIGGSVGNLLDETQFSEADFDALWFARASHQGREAWELRLLAEQPYALFETFAADGSGIEIEAAQREMENRIRGRAGKP